MYCAESWITIKEIRFNKLRYLGVSQRRGAFYSLFLSRIIRIIERTGAHKPPQVILAPIFIMHSFLIPGVNMKQLFRKERSPELDCVNVFGFRYRLVGYVLVQIFFKLRVFLIYLRLIHLIFVNISIPVFCFDFIILVFILLFCIFLLRKLCFCNLFLLYFLFLVILCAFYEKFL